MPYTWVCGIIRLFFVVQSSVPVRIRTPTGTGGASIQASPPDMIDRRSSEISFSSTYGHRLLERNYSSLPARLALCQETHASEYGVGCQTNSTWAIDRGVQGALLDAQRTQRGLTHRHAEHILPGRFNTRRQLSHEYPSLLALLVSLWGGGLMISDNG